MNGFTFTIARAREVTFVMDYDFPHTKGMSTIKHPEPTVHDIRVFLEVFKRLSDYEAQQRLVRNWGAFGEEEIPMSSVNRVLDWLRSKSFGGAKHEKNIPWAGG